MLVSLAITLIMMGAVVTIFGLMGDSVSGSRAIIETAERVRAVQNRLQLDLEGITAKAQPSLRPEEDQGYLEILEGVATDINPSAEATIPVPPMPAWKTMLGDTDDGLLMTVRSKGEPFVGRYLDPTTGSIGSIQSQLAEVIYYTVANGPVLDAAATDPATGQAPRLRTLYRRVLLVRPERYTMSVAATFFHDNDLSAHMEGSVVVGNTLGDLTKREYRYNHNAATFPHLLGAIAPLPSSSGRLGEDVVLGNVLSFDVQLFDENAPVRTSGTTIVKPTDLGYAAGGAAVSFGEYVDIGYNAGAVTGPNPLFDGAPEPRSGITARPFIFDTWSLHYEQDGVDQFTDGKTDTGHDGLDSDNNGVVDDPDEAETSAPYPSRLRGIQVKIRVYEPDSQAVREVTVVQDFLPE